MKATKPRPAIRLSITPEVAKALRQAKKMYPTLSDPEILKLGLAKITTSSEESRDEKERKEIMAMAAYSVGYDYLSDPEEDIYTLDMGKKVHFK
jgi:hypothetical protein